MILDCHVHTAALTGERGRISPQLMRAIPFRFMKWRLEFKGDERQLEQALERELVRTIDQTPELDAAVVLAFDAVYTPEGARDATATHLYVSNDHVMDLARRQRKVLFGASVHPYRRDAVAELERCVKGGAALLKWLPVTQGMDPADRRCIPFYEALAHHRLPLLCHTGGEETLTLPFPHLADPGRLEEALRRGVTVIAAHCGTRSRPWHESFVSRFVQMARENERFFGDTAGLTAPNRSYAWGQLLGDERIRAKLVHGSDWPVFSFPVVRWLGLRRSWRMLRERNWMRRDLLIKRELGLGEEYFRRAGTLLRLTGERGVQAD